MDETRYETGLKNWREIMGDAYVDRVLGNINDFNQPFRELVTEYAWGTVWDRPELDRRSRSLVTIGMLVALNKPQELLIHVNAAFRNGVTAKEISEVLLQSAIYCGVPAALAAYNTCMPLLTAPPVQEA